MDFEIVSVSSRVSKQPKPTSMEDLENSTEDDSLADCCPWLELTRCHCNCTTFPKLGKVLVSGDTPVAGSIDDSDEYSSEDEEQNDMNQDDVEEASEEEEEHEESVPMFTEYVPLRGSSFHQDCQSTLKKCRELLCAKEPVELRILPEPDNLRDCNALIIQAKVGSQWDRIGYIPKEKLPKFTAAIRNNEIKYVKFRNIKCQFIMTDTPTWTYCASVMVTKTGKWLPNDGNYKYNDQL